MDILDLLKCLSAAMLTACWCCTTLVLDKAHDTSAWLGRVEVPSWLTAGPKWSRSSSSGPKIWYDISDSGIFLSQFHMQDISEQVSQASEVNWMAVSSRYRPWASTVLNHCPKWYLTNTARLHMHDIFDMLQHLASKLHTVGNMVQVKTILHALNIKLVGVAHHHIGKPSHHHSCLQR